MTIEIVRDQLKDLKMAVAAAELNEVLGKVKKGLDLQWVSDLLQIEIDARKDNAIERRIKRANFPERRTLEQFDWNFNKKLPKDQVERLRSLKFIENNEIALFLGNPGTGKSHCAISIGILAARAGHSVYCTSVKRLCTRIKKAIERNTLDLLFSQILNSKLWILDDWGVVSMPRDVSEEVFDLFDRRKHSSAMLVTSNRDVEEWPQVFNEPILAGAAIDRMFERAEICIFEGPSYRMKGRINFKEIDKE